MRWALVFGWAMVSACGSSAEPAFDPLEPLANRAEGPLIPPGSIELFESRDFYMEWTEDGWSYLLGDGDFVVVDPNGRTEPWTAQDLGIGNEFLGLTRAGSELVVYGDTAAIRLHPVSAEELETIASDDVLLDWAWNDWGSWELLRRGLVDRLTDQELPGTQGALQIEAGPDGLYVLFDDRVEFHSLSGLESSVQIPFGEYVEMKWARQGLWLGGLSPSGLSLLEVDFEREDLPASAPDFDDVGISSSGVVKLCVGDEVTVMVADYGPVLMQTEGGEMARPSVDDARGCTTFSGQVWLYDDDGRFFDARFY